MTIAAERTLLAVARTVTSTGRVLDAIQLLRDDPRVQVVFTVNDTSPFHAGVTEMLNRAGARVIPWSEVPRLHYDAALTASENTELQPIAAPVLVLQHGAGFHKDLPDSRGDDGRRLSGTVRAADLRGRPVQIAVTHPDQAAQLATAEPATAGRTVLIADPMLDRMRATRLLRHRHRAALGLGDRLLVVVTSTWGRQSLIGRHPDLPARLLAALDADGHRVATVLHPNVTSGHGRLQVRLWLAAARDAGLLMVPPDEGWQPMIAAADCVVGDHSSMSLLAAGAGVPLLLAPLAGEVVPGTPMTTLSRAAARLDPARPLPEQINDTIAGYAPERYAAAVDATFATGPQARPLREVLYELLGLTEPGEPGPLSGWPPPVPESSAVGSFVVHTRIGDGLIEMARYPAAVRRHVPGPPDGWTGHLSAGDNEWDLRTLQSAEVLTDAGPDALDRFPGSALTCTNTATGGIVTVRDGRRAEVVTDRGDLDVVAVAACGYALARDKRLDNGHWRVRTARGEARIEVRSLPWLG
ncbi:hypothetical protein [Actinoplanes derwentensis]|uniref:Uncharacterized protein n=1 Tax=Actinoplanes derwentensis TaxID=113562 RepID=A0A1H2B997_9ACTN|nr:hypothetical protein [Actinoplanes derwentensis]GID86462.1 hypothetical protein Ade03nite_53860 [Actinoplanes derwentensis]SDT54632.1 hypothetical protein SAMN04489716_4430 [Actinoplanes derwentensis]